jgi:hypothetical protein
MSQISTEPLVTGPTVAKAINQPLWKVRKAAKSGAFPTYSIGNKRKLFRLSDVFAAIEASRQGGLK